MHVARRLFSSKLSVYDSGETAGISFTNVCAQKHTLIHNILVFCDVRTHGSFTITVFFFFFMFSIVFPRIPSFHKDVLQNCTAHWVFFKQYRFL